MNVHLLQAAGDRVCLSHVLWESERQTGEEDLRLLQISARRQPGPMTAHVADLQTRKAI